MLEKKHAILTVLLVMAIPVGISTFTSSTLAITACNKSGLTCASTDAFAPLPPCCVKSADSGNADATVNNIPHNPFVHVEGANPGALINPGPIMQATAGNHVVRAP